MRTNKLVGPVAVLALATIAGRAQDIQGIGGDPSSESTWNQKALESNHRIAASRLGTQPRVLVLPGDRILPQLVDGSGWKTTVTLVNLENHPATLDVLFFTDKGADMYLTILGQGLVRGAHVTLATAGSATFETLGTGSILSQGWASITQIGNDAIGALAVFKQRIPALPDQEAVVPVANQYDGHFLLMFDNTTFTTAIALVNPTAQNILVPISVRNEAGVILEAQTFPLGPYQHIATPVSNLLPTTAGKRGAIEVQASGYPVAGMGLRFNGPAFTSFHILENVNWSQNK